MAGPAFSRMMRMTPILMDFNHYYWTENSLKTGESIFQKSTSTYTVSICSSKEFQGQKLTSTYLSGQLICEFLRYVQINGSVKHGANII